MDTWIARAFLRLSLTREQATELRALENSLPPGRYFSAGEICRKLKLELKPKHEAEENAMTDLLTEFQTKILFPQRDYEETLHPKGCEMMSCTHPWDPRCQTLQQEIQQWEDFAIQFYHAPEKEKNMTLEAAFGDRP